MMNDSEDLIPRPIAPSPLMSYTCPGEAYSISHSIHLARLAAFYSKCQDCEHRFDAEHLFPRESERHPRVEHRVTRTSLVTDEGLRGVYLNELDRNRALAWGEAFAAALWNEQPMIARQEPADDAQIVDETANKTSPPFRGPTVVVGFDERSSSPDIVTGVVLGLRRMGCPVIDLGQTALPILAFHLVSSAASAGLFVTGAGSDPSLTGFEFLSRSAQLFRRETLLELEHDAKTGVARQTRQIGGHYPVQGQARYEAALESRFHALRPLKIVCGSATRLMPRILDRLFRKLPCQIAHVALPTRKRNLLDPRDTDLQRVAKSVVDGQHHLGLVIDEDGQHIAFVTDRGRLVTPREIARILLEFGQRENHAAKFVVDSSLFGEATTWLQGREATAINGGKTAEQLVRLLVEHEAMLGVFSDGRVWFNDNYPACDALLILASMLQALSLSDAPFSEVVARINLDTGNHA